MIKLLKNLISRLVPKQEEYSYVKEAVKFLNSVPKDCCYDITMSEYVGDIDYLQDKDGKTYYQDLKTEKYFCDYDMKNPSDEVLKQMINETTFSQEELEKKLKND